MAGGDFDARQAKMQFWTFAVFAVLAAGYSIVSAIRGNAVGAVSIGVVALYFVWRSNGGRKKLASIAGDGAKSAFADRDASARPGPETGLPHRKSALTWFIFWNVLALIAAVTTAYFAVQGNAWAAGAGGVAMAVLAQPLRAALRKLVAADRQD